jgi:hypothetical protein
MSYTGNLLGVLSARDSVLYQVYSKVYNPHSPSTVPVFGPETRYENCNEEFLLQFSLDIPLVVRVSGVGISILNEK